MPLQCTGHEADDVNGVGVGAVPLGQGSNPNHMRLISRTLAGLHLLKRTRKYPYSWLASGSLTEATQTGTLDVGYSHVSVSRNNR